MINLTYLEQTVVVWVENHKYFSIFTVTFIFLMIFFLDLLITISLAGKATDEN
jgi:hypothetical protein